MRSEPTERIRLRRKPARGHYDRETVYSLIDAGFVCHIGVTLDQRPVVIPTTYGRLGDHLYVHGSNSNRVLDALARRIEACIEITLIDGVVLGRSPMRHSMNYRSVVIYGCFEEALNEREKLGALKAILEHVVPGRLGELRDPSMEELARTRFLKLPLREYSAKIRDGGPTLDADDDTSVWSGVIPLSTQTLTPSPVDDAAAGVQPPSAVRNWLSHRRLGGRCA